MVNDHAPVILLVTSDNLDRIRLASVLEGAHWRLVTASSAGEALRLMRSFQIPLVLWDRRVGGDDWRSGLRLLAAGPGPPAVLLVSEVADPYLWEEVVRAGGFDILTRTFRRSETLALLGFALRHWEASHGQERRAS